MRRFAPFLFVQWGLRVANLAIFIDGAYIAKLAEHRFRTWVDYEKLGDRITGQIAQVEGGTLLRLRTYFYDALPYQGNPPTPDETTRFGKKRSFFAALARLPKFKVREGRTVRRETVDGDPTYHQKGVDLMIGLDIAALSLKHMITHAAIVSGDGDLLPAVALAQEEGIVVWHVHGPADTYADVLWAASDNRLLVDGTFMDAIRRRRST